MGFGLLRRRHVIIASDYPHASAQYSLAPLATSSAVVSRVVLEQLDRRLTESPPPISLSAILQEYHASVPQIHELAR